MIYSKFCLPSNHTILHADCCLFGENSSTRFYCIITGMLIGCYILNSTHHLVCLKSPRSCTNPLQKHIYVYFVADFTTILIIAASATCEGQIRWLLEDKFIKNSSITGKGFGCFNAFLVLKWEPIRIKILSSNNRFFCTS